MNPLTGAKGAVQSAAARTWEFFSGALLQTIKRAPPSSEMMRRAELRSIGSVPAWYSWRLVMPSPSGSHWAHDVELVVVEPKCASRQESEMPSPTESGLKPICDAPPGWDH